MFSAQVSHSLQFPSSRVLIFFILCAMRSNEYELLGGVICTVFNGLKGYRNVREHGQR